MRMLRHPPSHRGALVAWLARVVRTAAIARHRIETRRPVQRGGLDDSESHIGPPEELLSKQGIVLDVEQALEELERPYVEILRLRFFEDRSAREIARLRGIPVETVRTRIKRGLSRMRSSLDRKYGQDRSRWVLALAPFLDGGRALQRTGPGLPLLVASAVVTSGLVALLWFPPERPEAQVFGAARTSAIDSSAPRPTLEDGASRRVSLELGSQSPALRIRARTANTGQAVEGLAVHVERVGAAARTRERGLTGADGELVFADLAPGPWRIVPARGEPLVVDVDAVQGAEATIVVDAGLRIEGTVHLPGGLPAGGAEIWVSSPASVTEGEIVAHADAQGRFAVTGLDPSSWIGARAPEHRPSLLRLAADLGSRAESISLGLRSPSGFRGVVLDAEGGPVAGASLRVMPIEPVTPRFDNDGVLGCEPPSPMAWSGQDGRFELPGAPMLESRLLARHDGHADTVRHLRLEGQDNLRKGTCRLEVVLAEASAVDPGEGGAWIRGSVLDPQGAPLGGAHVVAIPAREGEPDPLASLDRRTWIEREAVSESDGAYRLGVEAAVRYDLFVRAVPTEGRPARAAAGVRGGSTEVVLRLHDEPRAGLSGRLDPAGDGLSWVIATGKGLEVPAWAATDAGGAFRFPELPAGSFSLFVLRSTGLARIEESVELEPGETRDLGWIAPPGVGSIEVQVRRSDGRKMVNHVHARLTSPGHAFQVQCGKSYRRVSFDSEGLLSAQDLEPGSYQLEIWAFGTARESLELVVRSGETTSANVELVAGVFETLLLYSGAREKVDLLVQDSAGIVVHQEQVELRDGRAEVVLRVEPGDFVLAARDGEDLLFQGPLSFRSGRHKPILIDLDAGSRGSISGPHGPKAGLFGK